MALFRWGPLLSTCSAQTAGDMAERLRSAGIACYFKNRGGAVGGVYTLYVQRADYRRACALVPPQMLEGR